ncbi:acyl-ACP--UDP-N-acetylglucosamine O-acyltransferase [Paenibacillus sp. JCM 10914]|uniref:acyl-ACP--UDP-N-acetylglucosamine O-acyltransferase n=1 Tax=Paenibacillus sp. JCM 10914 TaxID=1236974 RepID=UPI0003CC4E05|nr:acyl-ACP--UDP-N-acetylglucosamine O-acyltransferase [Paenibacillus sp. JCM 10914]GAE07852.1 nitrite reductase [Paenibacillus sp. JCM 10914]
MVQSTSQIHPLAIIHPEAIIGEAVEIGPFSIIEEHVVIGDRCKIESHVRIGSHTTLGQHNHIFQGAIIGSVPQDLSYEGQETCLFIGDHNTVREYATIAKGTVKGGGITKVGNNNLIMNYVHIAHDTVLGNHNILTNDVQLAGHVEIEDHVTIGGLSFVHQFCKIGSYAMIGARSGVYQDIVPYSLISGSRASIYGINVVGLRRNGMTNDDIKTIKLINALLFRKKLSLAQATEAIQELPPSAFKDHTLAFLQKSERGIARMK